MTTVIVVDDGRQAACAARGRTVEPRFDRGESCGGGAHALSKRVRERVEGDTL